MKVNVGTREKGYMPIKKSHEDILQNYLDNVAYKYEGDFVEINKSLAKDWLSKRNLVKYAGLVGITFLGTVTLIGLGTEPTAVFASTGGGIDTGPLDRLFSTVYWTMVKVLGYITTPVWCWVGYILATGGANSEKRTRAKQVATGLVIGSGIAIGAPYLTKQLFRLWHLVN
jgi:hypothetical protein